MLFTSCITSHDTLLLQDKQCYHERRGGLRASCVAPPPSGHDLALPEFERQRGGLNDSVDILINIRRLTLRSQFCFVKTFIGSQDVTIIITCILINMILQ